MRASTVDVEGGDAEQVGAPGVRALILQLLQCFPARVVVAVVRADRNHDDVQYVPLEAGPVTRGVRERRGTHRHDLPVAALRADRSVRAAQPGRR